MARGHVTYVDGEIQHVTKNRFWTSYEIFVRWLVSPFFSRFDKEERLVSPFFSRFDKEERLSWSFQVVLNAAKCQKQNRAESDSSAV